MFQKILEENISPCTNAQLNIKNWVFLLLRNQHADQDHQLFCISYFRLGWGGGWGGVTSRQKNKYLIKNTSSTRKKATGPKTWKRTNWEEVKFLYNACNVKRNTKPYKALYIHITDIRYWLFIVWILYWGTTWAIEPDFLLFFFFILIFFLFFMKIVTDSSWDSARGGGDLSECHCCRLEVI